MRKLAPALLALLVFAVPARADQCADDLAMITQALAKPDLPPDRKAQIEDMKKQADALCEAGHTQEGLDVLGDAKAQLNVH